MSAYQEYNTTFTDIDTLVEALLEMPCEAGGSYTRDMVEVHAEPQALIGYQNMHLGNNAEVIIRRKTQVKNAVANDIGWARQPDGTLKLFVSDYPGIHGEAWQDRLAQTYAVKHVEEKAKARGYSVTRAEVNGKIQMKLSRFR